MASSAGRLPRKRLRHSAELLSRFYGEIEGSTMAHFGYHLAFFVGLGSLTGFGGVVVGVVVIALMVAAFAIGYNRGEAQAIRHAREAVEAPPVEEPAEAEPPAPAPGEGLPLFQGACGACHTLAAAGTTATIGPDLDLLAPSREQMLAAIENGGSGTGQMPAGLLAGSQAELVAEFVAQSVGP